MTEFLLKLFVKDYSNTSDENVRKKYGVLGSVYGLVTNLLLFLGKITIGLLLHMVSIVADSVNNLSDFGTNFLSLFGFQISAKAADKEHPFGHQRMEYVVSMILGMVIVMLGGIMFYQGILDLIAFVEAMTATGAPALDKSFQNPDGSVNLAFFWVTLAILLFGILVKLSQSFLYRGLGKRIHSMELLALSKDSRNDVISTVLVLVGVIVTRFTSYDIDCFFTLAVSILVLLSGIGILREAADILIGQKPDHALVEQMIQIIQGHPGVLGMHDLTMHYYGKVIYAVIHIEVDSRVDVMKSHELCDNIEHDVYSKLHIHLTVHMDPILVGDPETEKYKKALEEAISSFNQENHLTLTMHDFRVLTQSNLEKLIFDLVIPDSWDKEAGKERIEEYLTKKVSGRYGKPVELVINFDDSLRDFLLGTEAEKREGQSLLINP